MLDEELTANTNTAIFTTGLTASTNGYEFFTVYEIKVLFTINDAKKRTCEDEKKDQPDVKKINLRLNKGSQITINEKYINSLDNLLDIRKENDISNMTAILDVDL